jgi:GNAT superfamily N-acetyltransferase
MLTVSIGEMPSLLEAPGLAQEAASLIVSELAGQTPPDPTDVQLVLKAISGRTTIVAQNDTGRVLATGALKRKGHDRGLIEDVATASEHRRMGLGSGIIRVIEQIAKQRGLTQLAVYPTLSSEGFYTKLGYIDTGTAFFKCLELL